MVRRCAWGTCKADERYPDKLAGSFFIPFPKPKSQHDRCLRWIRACGRPHYQLNNDRINKHKYVCLKHFVGGNGPTEEYPDPVNVDGRQIVPFRKRRSILTVISNVTESKSDDNKENVQDASMHINADNNIENSLTDQCVQTELEVKWISPLELLALTAELKVTKEKVSEQNVIIRNQRKEIRRKDATIKRMKNEVEEMKKVEFSVNNCKKITRLKNVFKFYTGITYIHFLSLFTFLYPKGAIINYESGRNDIKKLTAEDCLFLTLCRLRHNFCLKDLAVRFSLSLQSTSCIFNAWIIHMYFKFGQLNLWPHRDTILKNMPSKFRKDFPTTFIIIDGTEIKTQIPSALALQSQLYSDYKSSNTLKCLIGCDPSGSLIFVSELFTGSISDKELTKCSGFYVLLQQLLDAGYIHKGDSIMADKGFLIKNELETLGLKLNIPPLSSSSTQMSVPDTTLTQKIAKHRIHIERLISKIKTFKIISHKVQTSLFKSINQIWTVCCFLTLFQDVFVCDKPNK